MSDLFESPRLTILRAQHHIDDLNAKINEFVSNQPWSEVVEYDVNSRQNLLKIKFSRRLPPDLPCIVFDAANNLRAVLDQAGYAAAGAAGRIEPKRTQFPFGDDLTGLEDVIKRGRCRDLPPEILTLFRSFSPYKGGNDALWALNKLCNAKKHCALVPFNLGRAQISHMSVTAKPTIVSRNDDGSFQLTYEAQGSFITGLIGAGNPGWDPDKYEITLASAPVETNPQYQTHVALNVAFDGIETQIGKPAVAVLREMMRVVDGVLSATEAECRRLGFIK
jgi:hypothetical protein